MEYGLKQAKVCGNQNTMGKKKGAKGLEQVEELAVSDQVTKSKQE